MKLYAGTTVQFRTDARMPVIDGTQNHPDRPPVSPSPLPRSCAGSAWEPPPPAVP